MVINFKLNRVDVEEELLDRFLLLAKPRIDNEKFGLLQVIFYLIVFQISVINTLKLNHILKEKVDTLKIIDPLEQDITNFLASDLDLLNNVEPTKKLSDLKKLYDEAVDRLEDFSHQSICKYKFLIILLGLKQPSY